MKTAIIYHEVKPGIPCADGIASAWVARKRYPDAVLIGASYGGDVPAVGSYDHEGELVLYYDRLLIVDFSFSSQILNSWVQNGIEVTVIDHHKTALDDLSGFSGAIFDMAECGATLTWKTLFPEQPLPALLEYVKDRDLWNFNLELSEEIHEAVSFLGRSFHQLDWLSSLSADSLRSVLGPLGHELLIPKRKLIAEIAATARPASVKGYASMLVEVPENHSRLTSDVCSSIYKANPSADFVVAQSQGENPLGELIWKLAFRSDKNGTNFDVSAIAKEYFDGGGHRNAAGGVSINRLEAL